MQPWLLSRELGPKEPGVVTVGAFNSGLKHNVISDKAHLQLTVRYSNLDTKAKLLDGIKRIAEVAGKLVATPGEVREAINTARSENKNSVLVRVKSGDSSRFVAMPVAKG